MSTVAMAKKKTGTPDPNRKPVAVTIKGDPEWRAWLEEAAAHSRLSVSAFLDIAATRMAKAEGFAKKPPER